MPPLHTLSRLLLVLGLLSGCSMMRPATQTVTITVTDSEAELLADGKLIGKGSGTAELKRDQPHTFLARTADGRTATARLGNKMSATAVLDFVGGFIFIIPFFGLLAPGAWDLESTSVAIEMPRTGSPTPSASSGPPSVVDSSGTGVCINGEGAVLTAYHVVKDAKEITVHFADGVSARAEIDKWDATADVAVLKTTRSGTPYLTAAPTALITRGTRVFTVGFPAPEILGNDPKYSEGVINSTTGISGLEGYLQISIPIQPGNSGGAVVTDSGQIAGIITSTAAVLNFVRETGSLPQNINWATRIEKAIGLFTPPPALEPAPTHEASLDRAIKATCSIQVRESRS